MAKFRGVFKQSFTIATDLTLLIHSLGCKVAIETILSLTESLGKSGKHGEVKQVGTTSLDFPPPVHFFPYVDFLKTWLPFS